MSHKIAMFPFFFFSAMSTLFVLSFEFVGR